MTWALEKDLADDFRAWCEGRYIVHPECFGFDLVLVFGDDKRIGVQAKLRDPAKCVAQARENMKQWPQVDFAVVLMPVVGESVQRLCRSYSIGWIIPTTDGFVVELPEELRETNRRRKALPRYASNRPAGVPSPKALTPTREKELRLCAIIRRRKGFATSKDVKSCGLIRSFWRPNWIRFTGGVYKPVPGAVMPDADPDFADVAPRYAKEVS